MPAVSFAEFLESTPPGRLTQVSDLRSSTRYTTSQSFGGGSAVLYEKLAQPMIRLHCGTDVCGGERSFGPSGSAPDFSSEGIEHFLAYTCLNCGGTWKTFALRLLAKPGGGSGTAIKFGEFPPFGPPTPPRLLSLIGPDREAYLKGRRAESQGLGIGAFAYYRRIVEEQKTRLLDEILRVAERTQAPGDMIATLKRARGEQQFHKAVEMVRNAVPDSLKIDGHNPLVLLHRALSEGLHAQSDEECLELASDIRLVLEDLAERAAAALKDHAELQSAIARLTRPRKSGENAAPPPPPPPDAGSATT